MPESPPENPGNTPQKKAQLDERYGSPFRLSARLIPP